MAILRDSRSPALVPERRFQPSYGVSGTKGAQKPPGASEGLVIDVHLARLAELEAWAIPAAIRSLIAVNPEVVVAIVEDALVRWERENFLEGTG